MSVCLFDTDMAGRGMRAVADVAAQHPSVEKLRVEREACTVYLKECGVGML